MKNQALTTTLAILLAVSLSAIVALVVSSEVVGVQQVIADTPESIQTGTADADASTAEEAAAGDTSAQPADPADDPEDSAQAPDPADDPEDPATPPDPADDPEDPVDEPEEPGDPGTGEPPCEGTVVDGECVPPVSILCRLGYELVDNDCLFVGCPLGYALDDGICELLDILLPCPHGLVRNDAGTCVPDLVFDPPVFEPVLCEVGFKWVGGECVPVCPPNHLWVDGFCLPQFDLDLDSFEVPGIDLSAVLGS